MQKMIQYLAQNSEVAEKFREGAVEMVGISSEENLVLREVFSSTIEPMKAAPGEIWRA